MTRRSVDLHVTTDPDWVQGILADFDVFLADHANCERKASALAMSLVVKHPDRVRIIPTLIDVAREELEHFQQVYTLMEQRGLRLVRDEQDPYVNALLERCRHGRETQLLDRLLIASVVECRGAERFRIVAGALPDPELAGFYEALWKAETKHGHQFVDMALKYFPEEEVYARLDALMADEADIVRTLPWRASLH